MTNAASTVHVKVSDPILIFKVGNVVHAKFPDGLPTVEVLGMLEMAKDTALRTCCGDWHGPDGDVTDGGA